MSRASLDWTDAAVTRWLLSLRVAIDDADDITRDMMRPLRSRELGPRMHRAMYRDAYARVRRLLDYAAPATPDPERAIRPVAAALPATSPARHA